jgi:membrane protein
VGSQPARSQALIVVLLWLYYSSNLFLLGAEFTYFYTREFGSLRSASNDDVRRQRSVTAITGE